MRGTTVNRRMSFRTRLLAFGSAGALVIAGATCAAVVPGLIGQLLTTVLMSLGFAGAVLLVFLEVGLRRTANVPGKTGSVAVQTHTRAGSGTNGRRCVPGRLDRRVVRTESGRPAAVTVSESNLYYDRAIDALW